MRLPCRQCRRLACLAFALVLLLSLCPTHALADDPPIEGPVGGVDIELAWQLGGAITALDVVGDYAYLGIGPRLGIIDVSDPTNPVEVGRTDVLPNVESGEPEPYAEIRDVVVVDETAYIAVVAREKDVILARVDLHDPAAPRSLQGLLVTRCSLYPLSSDALRLWRVGDQLIVGTVTEVLFAPYSSLYAIVLSETPIAVDAIYQIYAHNMLCDLASSDGILFVLSMAADMTYQVEWEALTLPLETGRSDGTDKCFWTPDYGSSYCRRILPASWGMAVMSDARVYCLDLETAPHWRDPDTVPSCELSADNAVDATIMPTGDHAVVISESELLTVDLRNAGQPSVSGRAPVGGTRVEAEGQCAYVLDDNTLQIVDLADPTDPELLGTWHQPDWSTVSHLEVLSDDRMLVSAGSELLAIETPAGGLPTILGSLDVGVSINDFCLLEGESSDLLLATDGLGLLPVALGPDGIPVLDLSGKPEPCEVNYVNVAQTSWQEKSYSGEPRTVSIILAMTDNQLLTAFRDVDDLLESEYSGGTPVCYGFSPDQVVGRYAYVGRGVSDGEYEYSGQIEVYDLAAFDGWPAVRAVIPTEQPITSLVPHDGNLYVCECGDVIAAGVPGSSWLSGFSLLDPLAPVCLDATEFGQCQTSGYLVVSGGFIATKTTCAACTNNVNAGAYCGSSITVFRLNRSGGLDLQYVDRLRCSHSTVPVAFPSTCLLTADPADGLVSWRLSDRLVWGLFIEGEDLPESSGDFDPPLPQALGSDRHASECGYVEGQLEMEQDLPHDGDYYLWARLRESDGEDGTFSVYPIANWQLPRGGASLSFDGATEEGAWAWQRFPNLDDPCELCYDSASGEVDHYSIDLVLHMNHPSAAIDCLYLTDSPDALPPEITHCVPAGLALLPMIVR